MTVGSFVEDLKVGVVVERVVVGEVVDQVARSDGVERIEIPSAAVMDDPFALRARSGVRSSSPATWKVRPLTLLAASVHSHTTRGEILRGEMCSGSKTWVGPAPASVPW